MSITQRYFSHGSVDQPQRNVPLERTDTRAASSDVERMTGSSIPPGGHQGPYAKHVTATKTGDHRMGFKHSSPDKSSKGRR